MIQSGVGMEYTLLSYETSRGKCPFTQWLNGLKDIQARSKIRLRLERLEMGNFGHCKSIGDGVYELKIDCGPGYRVYYGMIGKKIVLLLSGGSKRTQEKDIEAAKAYFIDYKTRGN